MQDKRVGPGASLFENKLSKVIALRSPRLKPGWFDNQFEDKSCRPKIKISVWDWLLSQIGKDKSPGVPLCFLNSKNGPLLDGYGSMIRALVEKRLHKMNHYFENLYKACPGGIFRVKPNAVCVGFIGDSVYDPVRLFVKPEPKKKNKRDRLICSVSLVDALVEILLYGQQFELETIKWKQGVTSATLGIDLQTVSENIEFYKRVQSARLENGERGMVSTDVKGWEYVYGVRDEVMNFERMTYLVTGLYEPQPQSLWYRLAWMRCFCRMNPLFSLSDGTLFIKDSVQQLSGSRWTTVFNCAAREYEALCALMTTNSSLRLELPNALGEMPRVFENGDDCLEPGHGSLDSLAASYAARGIEVTDAQNIEPDGNFSYCSHTFTPQGAYPENPAKSIAHFAMSSRTAEQLDAIKQTLARIPGRQHLISFEALQAALAMGSMA